MPNPPTRTLVSRAVLNSLAAGSLEERLVRIGDAAVMHCDTLEEVPLPVQVLATHETSVLVRDSEGVIQRLPYSDVDGKLQFGTLSVVPVQRYAGVARESYYTDQAANVVTMFGSGKRDQALEALLDLFEEIETQGGTTDPVVALEQSCLRADATWRKYISEKRDAVLRFVSKRNERGEISQPVVREHTDASIKLSGTVSNYQITLAYKQLAEELSRLQTETSHGLALFELALAAQERDYANQRVYEEFMAVAKSFLQDITALNEGLAQLRYSHSAVAKLQRVVEVVQPHLADFRLAANFVASTAQMG